MKSYIADFFNLFFPRVCLICSKGLYQHEKHICRLCEKELPRSYFHLADDNLVEKLFWGRVNVKRASSFLLYTKGGVVKNILHSIKYRNNKELGYELAKLYSSDLKEVNFFDHIDVVIPVPLHDKKFQLRGYNQSEWIAKGFSESLSAELVTDNLFKRIHTSTQTKKGRYDRWKNVGEVFDIRDKALFEQKNILLVDDVLTTGATLEACANVLSQVEGITLNVVTLAYATI